MTDRELLQSAVRDFFSLPHYSHDDDLRLRLEIQCRRMGVCFTPEAHLVEPARRLMLIRGGRDD